MTKNKLAKKISNNASHLIAWAQFLLVCYHAYYEQNLLDDAGIDESNEVSKILTIINIAIAFLITAYNLTIKYPKEEKSLSRQIRNTGYRSQRIYINV